MLVTELLAKGINAKRGWSRYNNYFSLPLLGLTRIIGINYYEYNGGYLTGYHDFHKSGMVSAFFTVLQSIDVNIATYFKIVRCRKNNQILICDRGPFDTLVDVMIDTGKVNLGKGLFASIFMGQVRNKCQVIVLTRSYRNIAKMKEEVKYDRKIAQKIELYSNYAKYFSWPMVDNNGSIESTFDGIIEILDI